MGRSTNQLKENSPGAVALGEKILIVWMIMKRGSFCLLILVQNGKIQALMEKCQLKQQMQAKTAKCALKRKKIKLQDANEKAKRTKITRRILKQQDTTKMAKQQKGS